MLTSSLRGLSQKISSYPFSYIDNKIILHIQTGNNETLNFIFDTGGDGFLLDSTIALKYTSFYDAQGQSAVPFINGHLKSRHFKNNDIFKDNLLNKVFVDGDIIPMSSDAKKLESATPRHGIIGLNAFFKKYCISIDFEHERLDVFLKQPAVKHGEKVYNTDIISADEGHRAGLSQFYHKIGVKVEYRLSDKVTIKTNAIFDTGANRDFFISSSLNVDSLLKQTNKAYTVFEKKVSWGNEIHKLYEFDADSVIINENIPVKYYCIYFDQIEKGAMPEFGDLQTSGSIGAPFLKHFKKVTFDFPQNKCYFFAY